VTGGIRSLERPATRPTGPKAARFAGEHDAADVAVLAVTYNSADHIDELIASLRRQTAHLRLRVIVADNDSSDDTVTRLRRHDDVILVGTGGNLGYAAGINTARAHAGDVEAVFVVNPDLTVAAGAIQALLVRMRTSDAAVVVPRIRDASGRTYPSIRREPSLTGTLGDAVFGQRMPRRPAFLSELVFEAAAYRSPHRIDWATGAALLVRQDVADRIGDWDERYFLYSEETDFFRRVRETGGTAWFEPAASVQHSQGGSGGSAELDALRAVNRVRYARRYHGALWAEAMRGLLIAQEAVRASGPTHRHTAGTLLRRSSWSSLPRARRREDAPIAHGSIVIPAHNEAAVIERTLRRLEPIADRVRIVVACNGCSDDTAERAARVPGIEVIEVATASKIAALNAADEALASQGQGTIRTTNQSDPAYAWPRLYLDADIELDPAAVRDLFATLARGRYLAGRPAFRYLSTGASWPVRRYYAARTRLPGTRRALWGAGAYAVTEEGHARLGRFPDVVADDLWVDSLFSDAEKVIVHTMPAIVRTPRDAGALRAILRRTYRGNALVPHVASTRSTARELLASVSGPVSAIDAAVYAMFAFAARAAARRAGAQTIWERDESSREQGTSNPTSRTEARDDR
jgi:GT2 family glycosyltransferase